jgi:phosphoribosylformylglycinamidine synthase subunit PurS
VNEYHIEVRIAPRAGLLDPEGQAVHHALQALDFENVSSVRIGRLVRITLRAGSEAAAHSQADAMCRRLLANPVTEDFEIAIGQAV